MDWITDLPPSHYHDAILVVVDRLTKAAHFIPTTKSMAAPDVASLFLQHVVRAHRLPDTLVSDRDSVFTSHFWRRLLELCGIQANRSTAFHPQTDIKVVVFSGVNARFGYDGLKGESELFTEIDGDSV